MHTPEGTLERGRVPAAHFSVPIQNTQPLADYETGPSHVLSLPGNDEWDNFSERFFQIQDNNKHGGETAPSACQDSSPDTPQPQYDLKQGWVNGIFGCLRPVLSIIGKGVVENRPVQDNWEIPFECISNLTYLDRGGQGTVFTGMLYNTPVAVKKVADLKDADVKNLRKLNHPNIVKFKGICREKSYLCIVMEFCSYGPLSDILKKEKNVVTLSRVLQWGKQIAGGMHYLHTHKIIHRDLKSPNVLIGENEIIKISDFGTSRTWNGVSEKMTFAGTVAWMAPEAIREENCSEKVDIWAYGVVLWELLTCEVPYDGMEHSTIMYLVGSNKLRPPIPSTCPEFFKLLMQMCWKETPHNRPSFKLIITHFEEVSVEILSKYEDQQFFKTQESWKKEIKSHYTQYVEQMQKHKLEYKLKEEHLIKMRENELKNIREMKELYEARMKKIDKMYLELESSLVEVKLQAEDARKRRLLPFSKKISRRRCLNQSRSTPTSPESNTSPDILQPVITKAPLYAKLNPSTETVTTQTSVSRRRQSRTNSCSPRCSTHSHTSSSRASTVVDAETQTESMDVSENDLSPTASYTATYPQKVILQEFTQTSSEEGVNGNCVHLHYMPSHPNSAIQVFTRLDSRSNSPIMFDEADSVNKNIPGRTSSDEYLDTIERRVSEIKIDTIFSKNGNVGEVLGVTVRKKMPSETRDDLDSTEDAANDDSPSDEEGEVYNTPLKRRSMARRPIYPGRRSQRSKVSLHHYQRDQQNASDEGNTSEYSVSPSSKSSTLESNPDRGRGLPNLPLKRPNERLSDGSSDSDSEENMTIVTQFA